MNIKYISSFNKENIKTWIKSNRNSQNKIIKLSIFYLYIIKHILYEIKRFCEDKQYRYILFMKLFKSKEVHQTTSFTCMNRYPLIFAVCKVYFRNKDDIKILSYGCSTGEEVLTLRKYFSNAIIIGTDINKASLKICKKKCSHEKNYFIESNFENIEKNGKYDIIFCMAVFQRTPEKITKEGVTTLKKIYPFEKFEKQVVELDKQIKVGGLLVIHFSQYSFADTYVSLKYKALGNYNQDDYKSVVFDRNSNLIKEPSSQKSIFIKMQD